ncbi:MAG: DUF2513 domain-containing protein [Humidesulfovibrio sp.]|nr:DUF2513 domain-containing protein [Humidesulfovibrio sp.]
MGRDWERIRKIVLAVEDHPAGYAPDLAFDGYTSEQIGYHCYLLADAGFAKGLDNTTLGSDSPQWIISHLTSAGHDFAEASRNDSVWASAMKLIKDKAGTVTADVLKVVLAAGLKSVLGLP